MASFDKGFVSKLKLTTFEWISWSHEKERKETNQRTQYQDNSLPFQFCRELLDPSHS